jgi:transcriptional regulator with XRE-family HTH domain
MPARVDFQPEPELMNFGRYVKQARQQMGISQDQLAEKVGISVGYVGAIERKQTQRPAFDVVFKICKVLNISLDNMLFKTEDEAHLNAKEELKQRIDQCDSYEVGLLEATFTAILAYHRFFEMNETMEEYEKTADNS